MHPNGKVHGGIALIIKSSVRHYEIGKYQREFLQAINAMNEDWKNGMTVLYFCRILII